MTNSQKETSSCLCGQVKITAKTINPQFTVCHCKACRSWGGAPFFAVQCGTEVDFEHDDKIKEFDSSAWAKRGFCSDCGTHLYYRLKKTGEYNMPVGLFPDLKDLKMNMQYFSDRRPNYYCFSNETQEMSSAEIEAYFASEL